MKDKQNNQPNKLVIFRSKKIREREEELGIYIGTNCPYVEMLIETWENKKSKGHLLNS